MITRFGHFEIPVLFCYKYERRGVTSRPKTRGSEAINRFTRE